MLKGHVCIELHNHKTGLRDRIEGNNTIVNGLKYDINMLSREFSSYSFSPIANVLFGGLLLINKSFSEDSVFLPGDATVIGAGNQGANTSSEYIGSINSLESGINAGHTTYTQTWDFSTSQANGIINAAALVYRDAVLTRGLPFKLSSFDDDFLDTAQIYIVHWDFENNDIYYCKERASDASVYKYKYNPLAITLYDNIDATYRHTQLHNGGLSTGRTINNSSGFFMHGYDGYEYLVSFGSGNTVVLKQIKVSDLSFDIIDTVTYNLPGAIFKEYGNYSPFIALNAAIGRLYVYSSNRQYVYMVNLSTSSVTTIDVSSSGFHNVTKDYILWTMSPNGALQIERKFDNTSTRQGYCITIDGRVDNQYYNAANFSLSSNFFSSMYQANNIQVLENGISIVIRDGGAFVMFAGNLLTTNYNLPQQIEKTSASSMKVIYSITQV